MNKSNSVLASFLISLLLYGGTQFAQGQQKIGSSSPVKPSKDSDRDGLPDSLEKILQTDPDRQDTDQDGFPDPEELARKSNPLNSLSVPNPQAHPKSEPSLGLLAEQTGASTLETFSVIYLPAGWQPALTVELVRLDAGGNLEYSNQLEAVPQFVHAIAGKKPGTQVVTLRHALFPASWISQLQTQGVLSVASVLDNNGQGLGIAADDAFFRQWDGVFCQWREISPNQETAGPSSSGIYKPLGESSTSWEAGKICEQTMVVSGVNGPTVLMEVVDAGCKEQQSSFCAGACPGSVGQTIQQLDPLALIGG